MMIFHNGKITLAGARKVEEMKIALSNIEPILEKTRLPPRDDGPTVPTAGTGTGAPVAPAPPSSTSGSGSNTSALSAQDQSSANTASLLRIKKEDDKGGDSDSKLALLPD